MMNKQKRLHPLYILFPLVTTIKSFAPLILLAVFKWISGDRARTSDDGFPGFWLVLAIAVFILLLLLYGWMQWKRCVYVLEDDKIIIRRGVISREEISLYTGRIHSMNLEQPLVQRILGLNQIRIETPGGSSKGTLLPALSNEASEQLQRWLGQRIAAGKVRASNQTTAPTKTVNPIYSQHPLEAAPLESSSSQSTIDRKVISEHIQDREGHIGMDVMKDMEDIEEVGGQGDTPHSSDVNEAIPAYPEAPEERTPLLHLSNGRLLIAALSSLNLSLAIAFLAGIYSFADDILPDRLYQQVFAGAGDLLPGGWISLIVVGIILAWLLSGILYTIKYAGFTVERIGKQYSVTCGLLERKQFVFSPERVQAVSVKEGLLRGLFGYGEVKLHVLTSEENKQLILHPLILTRDIPVLLENILPKFRVEPITATPPRRARWLYLRWKLLIAAAICTACIWYFHQPGLWSLLLLPVVAYWGFAEHRDTGMALHGKQLTLRSRSIALTTCYIRRPQIVTVDISGTRRQRRKQLLSLDVSLITTVTGTRVVGMEQSEVRSVWKWFSKSGV